MSSKLKKLAGVIGQYAPMLGSAIGTVVPGASLGGDLIGAVAKKFGVETQDPDELINIIATDPESALKFKELEKEHETEITRVLVEKAIALEQEITKQASKVNDTMQAELVNTSTFKSCWRPFNGWILGINTFLFTVSIIVLAFLAVLTKNTDALLMIPNLIAAYSVIIGTQCAVVGVSAHSRGQEKLAKMGVKKPGFLETIVTGLKK